MGTTTPSTFAAYLRDQRQPQQLSLRQLARTIHVHHGTLARLEQGEIAAPSPDILARLAEALSVPLADLFAHIQYTVPRELPSFTTYLQTCYQDLSAASIAELDGKLRELIARDRTSGTGPINREDEAT